MMSLLYYFLAAFIVMLTSFAGIGQRFDDTKGLLSKSSSSYMEPAPASHPQIVPPLPLNSSRLNKYNRPLDTL